MEELLERAPCGFLALDDGGAILLANRTLGDMLQASPGQLQGRHIDRLLNVPGRIFYQTHVFPTLKLQGQVHEIYLSLVDADGIEVPVLLNAVRRARDDRFVSECVVVPMRQRNEYENEILKARKLAEDASRAKDDFLALVSHELRSPLSAISGWAHILAQPGSDEALRVRGIAAIQQNTRAQVKLVDDLLDYGRISAGKLRLELSPVQLDSLVASVVEGISPTAEAKGVRLDGLIERNGVVVSADADRLRQVLWNMLTNAVKFTPKDGQVDVRLQRVDSMVEIVVRDTGRGIAPEFLPVLFDRFRQENGSVRREGGLGLGMAIARQLVELHGGTIAAESPGRDQGSTFRLRLPVLIGHEAAVAGHKAEMPQLRGMELLVVDDDGEARAWLGAVLTGAGARVRTAASAAEALSAYHERRPAVLVSDIEMAGGDGFQLIRRVRELEEGTSQVTPAIALTGRAQAKDRIRAMSAGFQLHLPKPVDPLELLLAIDNLGGIAAARAV
jgi:signal transduction histidine kinase/CheY-like chemotaxis protein